MRTTDGYGLAQVSGSGQQDFNQSSRRCCDSDYRSVEPCQARRSHRLKLLAFLRSPSATRQSSLEALPEILDTPSAETHGFAPLPRDRFALIVCNHRLAKDQCRP